MESNKASVEFINLLKDKSKEGNITLIYAAKDPQINHAIVLKEWLFSILNLHQ